MTKKMMRVLIVLVFACSSILLMASCAKRQVKGEEVVKPAAPMEKKEVMTPRTDDTRSGQESEAERQARLRELERQQRLRAAINEFESESIYFDFDKSELLPDSRVILAKKAKWLRENQGYSVRIEGHCDERGTNEYNLALGERRANTAWKFLNALGISGSRITSVSYGEEKPAATGHNEQAWSKNRRDEFRLIK